MAFKLASRSHIQRDFTPTQWTEYFDEAHDIQLDQDGRNSFRVYLRNFRPPYAPERQLGQRATANLESNSVTESDMSKYSLYPTLVMLHGGGYSGLTWAQFTRYAERECQCRFLAIDLRSHGDTRTDADDNMDIETLVEDTMQVIHATHGLCGFVETPKVIIIGHSMGGAIAIKCADKCLESLTSLAGIVVIDVVEGTAKDALPVMMSVIRTRPSKFPSLQNAIEWCVRSGMTKNTEAAKVSMPGNLLNMKTGHLSIHDIASDGSSHTKKHKFDIDLRDLAPKAHFSIPSLPPNLPMPPRIANLRSDDGVRFRGLPTLDEQKSELEAAASSIATASKSDTRDDLASDVRADEQHTKSKPEDKTMNDDDCFKKPQAGDNANYCWRTNLAKTQAHWPGWFEGLSEMMLNAPVQGKFLLLAGIDRLDKTLTIGQMQGKFMMRVLPKCGHAVHEDSPERVASAISEFLIKNKFTLPQS